MPFFILKSRKVSGFNLVKLEICNYVTSCDFDFFVEIVLRFRSADLSRRTLRSKA